ncbi:hypothetical protein N9L47_01665 [Rhodobacteraceae bacterium]|nr:hypothetical protein [Paracoccaceae bacterium]
MIVRVVFVVLVLGLIGAATFMSINGVWGDSSAVISTRNGSPGGGYGIGGRGVK